MCGIFGIVLGKESAISQETLRSMTDTLFRLSESRGKEASGLALLSANTVRVYKQPIPGSQLIQTPTYHYLFSSLPPISPSSPPSPRHSSPLALIGHSRLATNGLARDNHNNQPVAAGTVVMVHNGIIVNDQELWRKFPRLKRQSSVDTEVICKIIDYSIKMGKTPQQATQATYSNNIQGAASIAYISPSNESPSLTLATNTGSLYTTTIPDQPLFVFASEKYILETFLRHFKFTGTMRQIKAGTGMTIPLSSLRHHSFSLTTKGEATSQSRAHPKTPFRIIDVYPIHPPPSFTILPSVRNNLKDLMQHKPNIEKIDRIRRCSKCILPETMPFIEFDDDGICNYCKTYKKVRYYGKHQLEDIIRPLRKKNGPLRRSFSEASDPDCIVALSGGRDSSYGLHCVKTILKLNPVAYTYDWGMVTDIARRNQSRLTATLGVEHIIVSADIERKRENIKKNIEAWLGKPDLGMVPLFMAGDKQAEYYAQDLRRKTGIDLIIYCRGNELEDEKFKFGHCGIRDGTPRGVLHNLSLTGKLQLATYYAKQFLTNPRYVNTSLVDTATAYASAYLIPYNFLYLYHYIPWNEEEIVSTLKKTYQWETAADTIATWRIDDGSVPFYNYIYYTVQGFTEHDCLRSNQIREGIITRKKALELVREENQPRYEALKWYFDAIGLNGQKILTAIDRIPKRYK